MDVKCKGTTKKGTACTRRSKYEGFCGMHKPKKSYAFKFDGLDAPRLPENIEHKLANCSDVGIKKIKEDIIRMWLEDGGSYSILAKYNNKIPVATDVYNEIIKKFNGEVVVVSQIFVTEFIPKQMFYGSSRAPMVPIDKVKYEAFIPKGVKEFKKSWKLTKKQEKAFRELQDFIFNEWKKLGEILQNGKIYLIPKVYEGAKTFLYKKFQEIDNIDINYWFEYFMNKTFGIGEELKYKNNSRNDSYSNAPPPIPKPQPDSISLKSKISRSITTVNLKPELLKLFKDKDIEVFIKVVQTTSNVYPINSKADIHKLYLEFHPDKCDNDPKLVKLCNVFCAKVENIKKIWEHSKNPKVVTPPKIRGNDIESVLRILNNEI
jgi:hypothetical protein